MLWTGASLVSSFVLGIASCADFSAPDAPATPNAGPATGAFALGSAAVPEVPELWELAAQAVTRSPVPAQVAMTISSDRGEMEPVVRCELLMLLGRNHQVIGFARRGNGG